MTNELSQHGSFNIGIQDIQGNVNVTQILGKSVEYKDLLSQLETQRELFAYVPEDQTEKRLRISQTIAQLEAQIEQFKQDVTKLAQEFNRIEINTDRLRRAKEHFEQGEIAAARAVFDSEREQMQDENNRLVREKERYEQDVLPKLKHSSDEFYLRALLERTAYDNPNWLADTCEYFERSINAQATEGNVFQYAMYLQNHNQFEQAETHYRKYLNEFVGEDPLKRAMLLNNLANLHRSKNEFAEAKIECMEVLGIYRNLAISQPDLYLPYVGRALTNLSALNSDIKEWDHAEAECCEALEIYSQLILTTFSPCLPDLAGALNNLAGIYRAKNALTQAGPKYNEALVIFRGLAIATPLVYLPYVARTLNNLAGLHRAQNEWDLAEAEYREALELFRDLALLNPAAYLPDLATTRDNLARVQLDKNEFDKAEANCMEALKIRRELAGANPTTYLQNVAATLNNLTILHSDKNEFAKAEITGSEALAIFRELSALNPSVYLPDVARTLNNLANMYSAKKEADNALAAYAEALSYYRELASVYPSAYLPYVARALVNIAICHQQSRANRQQSVNNAIEAVKILLPIADTVPYSQIDFEKAMIVLQDWSLSIEDIQQMLSDATDDSSSS